MYHLFKAFFGVTALAALLALCVYSGCADIPDNNIPDDPVDAVAIADTSFYGDTLVVCVTTIAGSRAASVRCDTTVYGGMSVRYAVSRVDGRVNSYCLFPVTFTAFPSEEDLRRIDAIYVDPYPGDTGAARIRLSPPEWSAAFAYADTGAHTAKMLVATRGGAVLEEEFEVRTELKIDVTPIRIPVGDAGVEYALRANGLRHSGVWWVWDLTNINNGVIKTREDSVSIFVDGEYDTEVYLYQEDGAGGRTPGTAVGFAAVYTAHNVVVSVEGGDAEVFPQKSFSVPHAGDATVSVRVNMKDNLRIGGIGVNGEQRHVFDGRAVGDTAITIENIRSNTGVLVTVAKIDTVQPVLTVIWPVKDTSTAMTCVAGTLGYRLNKKMASGYIKWTAIDSVSGQLRENTAVTVAMPGDLNIVPHFVAGDIAYASPSAYLNEGVQKYRQYESARKQFDFQIGVSYKLEMQVSDSLGNKSNTVFRVTTIAPSRGGCSAAVPDWIYAE